MTSISRTQKLILQKQILRTRIHCLNYEDATHTIVQWAKDRQSCYVCAANVHMLMEAWDSLEFAKVLEDAAMVTPDGMPLVWGLRLLGFPDASRVYGPTLTLHICEAAAGAQIPIGLYGGTPESLREFTKFLESKFPSIRISCAISPPFRPLTSEEDNEYTQTITNSGVKILLVGIGCPKQEKWMAAHQGKVQAVMLGVGAAFDFHSGQVKQAPTFMQQAGLEWLFRLIMEPRRLWKRYIYNNPRYICVFIIQLLRKHFNSSDNFQEK